MARQILIIWCNRTLNSLGKAEYPGYPLVLQSVRFGWKPVGNC